MVVIVRLLKEVVPVLLNYRHVWLYNSIDGVNKREIHRIDATKTDNRTMKALR
jgi:hypothetical protein